MCIWKYDSASFLSLLESKLIFQCIKSKLWLLNFDCFCMPFKIEKIIEKINRKTWKKECSRLQKKKKLYTRTAAKKSFASNKVFIRWWPWVQAWFQGWSIITTNPGHPSSISQFYQTLLDGVWSVWMPYPFRCSYSLVLDLFYIFPLLCWSKSEFG